MAVWMNAKGKGKMAPGWWYTSLDAVLTAHLDGGGTIRDLFRAAFRRKSPNFKRVSSLLNLLDRLLPGLAKRLAGRLVDLKHFPLTGYHVSLLAYGFGGTVFLLEKDGEKKVMKVYRRSLGRKARTALAVAREYHSKHQLLTGQFNGAHEIVIPSEYMVLHGPLVAANSAAVIQPFVAGKTYDLFEDFTEEEAAVLARRDSVFADQLLHFSRRLSAMIEEQNLCFDLVGRENLMLVETSQGIRLKIADIGVLDLRMIGERSPALINGLNMRLNKLQKIKERLERRGGENEQPSHT